MVKQRKNASAKDIPWWVVLIVLTAIIFMVTSIAYLSTYLALHPLFNNFSLTVWVVAGISLSLVTIAIILAISRIALKKRRV